MYLIVQKFSLTLLMFSGVFGALAQESSTVRKSIQMQMDLYGAAAKRKDFATMDKIIKRNFASSCVITTVDGRRMTRDQWMAANTQNMKLFRSVKTCQIRIHSFLIRGKTATSKETFKLVGELPSLQDSKKNSVLEIDGTTTSSWQLQSGKWQCVGSKDQSTKMVLDGKPFKPGG